MKKIIVLAMFALMAVSVLALNDNYKSPFGTFGHAGRPYGLERGVERVTNYDPRINFARIDTTVYLGPPGVDTYKGVGRGGYAPFYMRGTARVKSSSWYGYPRAQVVLNTKDLPASDEIDSQYEVWLLDLDSGYRLSLGTFTTLYGGVGEMSYNANTYFDSYDLIEVTVEPFDDADVSPGPVALLGYIPPPTYFNPAPKSSNMVTNTYFSY